MKAEQIITSFEKGKKSVEKKILPIADDNGDIELNIYNIYPQMEYQKFQFFGGAITYAAGEVLSSVPEDISREIINSVFSPNGLQYRSIRTHIDSCDFSTQQYCALNNPSDTSLSSFSIAHDKEKIIPWIKAAYKAAGKDLPVMLTPWTPPEFMKTNESRIGGGRLKKEYYNFWAKYLCRYILEYRDCGIFVNSLSIQNEPNAVQSWDSCIFSPEEEKRFIADSLYPELVKSGLADIELFIWDHNKERAFDRACATIGNETVNLISGVAVHWYSGDHFDALRLIRQKFPSKSLVFTEGCIEYSRFDKNQIKNAQKYAHDIIGNFSAGLNASYDWNICLDSNGGPNYVGNYCEAPVMINKNGRINYNLYSFYKDARLRRLTRYRYNASPLDSDGFHIYIKDADTIWNPGWQPVQTELDYYQCRHGMGYSIITGEKDGLRAKQELLVPRGENCLLIRVTAENQNENEKKFSLFPYVEFCLWDANDDANNFQRNYSTGEVEVIERCIIHKTEYRERRNHFAALFSNRAPDGYDTARNSFLGVYGGPSNLAAVLKGKCTNSIAHGWQPVGAMQFDMCLQSGQKEEILLCLAYIDNGNDKWEDCGVIKKDKLFEKMEKYSNTSIFDECMAELKRFWNQLLSQYKLVSENSTLDRMVNIWNQYQCMVTFNMSRSASYFESGMGRGMGFRDSCQDLLGFVHMIPERARERILDIAATQFPDGSAYHQYQPLTKRGNLAVGSGFNDDPLWLVACTDAYLRETGDWSILSETVPFDNDESLSQPLLEHLRRSISYTTEHLGPHGLPLIGRADWNDCLYLNCFSSQPGESFQTTGPNDGPIAESVFIAGMFVKYGCAYANILSHIGCFDEQIIILNQIENMKKNVLAYGWDGEWFIRAYDAFGKPVGSKECTEGQIFIEPQGMCVMAGIGKETGEAEKALSSVKERLETKYGVVLNQPAYTSYHLELGEISSYPPGYKENASIFCHNNAWVVCAEAEVGHGNRAFELYKKTAPAFLENISEIHRTEPYVYCQMIAGRDAPTFGEAKNSWLTGTAAWTFVSISQYILGVIPEYEGIRISPCIPKEWKEYSVIRRFRGAEYHIHIINPDSVESGIKEISVNGDRISDNILPLFFCGETANIEVLMG